MSAKHRTVTALDACCMHAPTCWHHVAPGSHPCDCGVDVARAELAGLRTAAARAATLEAAIRQHRDERGNARCWLDDQRLYAVLGEAQPDTTLPPEAEFLENCRRFHATRQARAALSKAAPEEAQ